MYLPAASTFQCLLLVVLSSSRNTILCKDLHLQLYKIQWAQAPQTGVVIGPYFFENAQENFVIVNSACYWDMIIDLFGTQLPLF